MGSGAGRYNGQELNATSPLRRDTVFIPAYSWVVLRFVTDNREHIHHLLGIVKRDRLTDTLTITHL
jgi:multicopper oxidase